MVKVVTLGLQTIGSQMSLVQSHPCSSLERNQQTHEESAS